MSCKISSAWLAATRHCASRLGNVICVFNLANNLFKLVRLGRNVIHARSNGVCNVLGPHVCSDSYYWKMAGQSSSFLQVAKLPYATRKLRQSSCSHSYVRWHRPYSRPPITGISVDTVSRIYEKIAQRCGTDTYIHQGNLEGFRRST